MTEPEFLRAEIVIRLHDRALQAYGGIAGVRDENLLHSALARPQNRYAYADPDTLDQSDLAAAYAFGLASNHPFNDGNKRTAWSSCVLFLKLNGVELQVLEDETVEQVIRLASRQLDETDFAAWLRTCRRP